MSNLRFITDNPALTQFNAQEKFARDNELSERRALLLQQQHSDLQASAPGRLRTIDANADLATSRARVAGATEEDDVTYSGHRTRTAGATADTTESNARVARETEGNRVESSDLGVQAARAAVTNAQAAGFSKIMDFLKPDNFHPEAAREVARLHGMEIPEGLIENSDFRNAMLEAHRMGKEAHPNNPRLAAQTAKSVMVEWGRIAKANRESAQGQVPIGTTGEPANQPRLPATVYDVPGAPEPAESGAQTGQDAPDVRTMRYLVASGIAPNEQAAWTMVRQSRGNPEQTRAQIHREALRASGGDAVEAERTTLRAMQFLNGLNQQGAAPAAPSAAPAAPVAPAARTAPAPAAPQHVPPANNPAMMTPGNGQRPLDIQAPPLPPNVPRGISYQYSPSLEIFKLSDGRMYDRNGNQVQQ